AGEVRVARDDLEVVLDQASVLADVVLGQLADRVVHHLVVRPQSGLAGADDPVLGVDAYEQAAVDQERRDALDLQPAALLYKGACWATMSSSSATSNGLAM